MSTTDSLDDDQLEALYSWIDKIPLSKPKRNISRDFSDGVLVAEMIKYFFPKFVELHNYNDANSSMNKKANWSLLNNKVLVKRFHFELADEVVSDLIQAKPFTIEKVLIELKSRIDNKLKEERMEPPPPLSLLRAKESDQPEADQYTGRKGTKGKNLPLKAPQELPPPPFERITHKNLGSKDPIMTETAPRRQQGRSKKDNELSYMYEMKEQECLAKEERIAMLDAKRRQLEHLLDLKDTHITELGAQLEMLRPTGGIK
ncbi:sperm flagellar protein 1-like isoform X2 [Ylistrum balloti]|uniref:sperm flagellar protein 1-like isoform X2 n=1 Tax=Ylistrum balloti TaxID=509963 RepID=UPI00290593DC|nr:sperm flagellar protein 1-like isoform X2 [Ylistrum balloti]